MKKLSLLIAIATFTGFIFSSCSRLENISINKRHYRSGYNIDFGLSKQEIASQSRAKKVTPTETADLKCEENQSTGTATGGDMVPTPMVLSKQVVKEKQTPKTNSSAVYSSRLEISAIREQVKAEEFNSQVTSLSKSITDSSTTSSETPMWLLIVLSILLPPLAVGLKFGIIDKFWISCLLTVLFWIPGVIYALIVITKE